MHLLSRKKCDSVFTHKNTKSLTIRRQLLQLLVSRSPLTENTSYGLLGFDWGLIHPFGNDKFEKFRSFKPVFGYSANGEQEHEKKTKTNVISLPFVFFKHEKCRSKLSTEFQINVFDQYRSHDLHKQTHFNLIICTVATLSLSLLWYATRSVQFCSQSRSTTSSNPWCIQSWMDPAWCNFCEL